MLVAANAMALITMLLSFGFFINNYGINPNYRFVVAGSAFLTAALDLALVTTEPFFIAPACLWAWIAYDNYSRGLKLKNKSEDSEKPSE